MNLLLIIGYSVMAIVGLIILAGIAMTWALSRMPDDTDWIFEHRGPLDHDRTCE